MPGQGLQIPGTEGAAEANSNSIVGFNVKQSSSSNRTSMVPPMLVFTDDEQGREKLLIVFQGQVFGPYYHGEEEEAQELVDELLESCTY